MIALNRPIGRIERFRCCGARCTVWQDGEDIKIQAQFCRDRWCETCQARAAARARAAIMDMYQPGNTRHIVLTMKHSMMPLKAQVKRLRACFQALRRTPEWHRYVTGGAAMVEIKLNKAGDWHPHLHIIATGTWFDQRLLSRLWYEATGDSSYVWIKKIDNSEQQVNYVCKYVTKACDHSVYHHMDKLEEAMTALHAVKLMSTFGTWKHIKLRVTDPDPDPSRWKWCGTLTSILDGTSEWSQRWFEVLSRRMQRRMITYCLDDDTS